jgi:polyisoprenoid-binding protein YceI
MNTTEQTTMGTNTTTTTQWAIDPTHSEIQFKVKHLMITTVTGSFQRFGGQVEAPDNDLHNARISF